MILEKRNVRRRRHGFMLFEFLIAVAFLMVVTGFMLKVHQWRIDHDRTAMDRLRHQLGIENLAEQLSSVPFADIPNVSSELATEHGSAIRVDPITVQSRDGWHVVIEMETQSGPLRHHLWRLEPTP